MHEGLALGFEAMCALRDGVISCWGDAESPRLGTGASSKLAAPMHLAAFDGADMMSNGDGVTCVRTNEKELRCFGRPGILIADPLVAIALPEPIDRMKGGAPLCVRGAQSHAWYCRDPFQEWFPFGPLAGGWTRLPPNIVDVAPGAGLIALTSAGFRVDFAATIHRKPMPIRFTPYEAKGFGRSVAALINQDTWVLPDGTARSMSLSQRWPVHVIPAGFRDVLDDCFVTASGTFSCSFTEGVRTVAEHIAIMGANALVTDDGRLLRRENVWEQPAVLPEITGVPRMTQLAGDCGISVDKQVWCWGDVAATDLPPYRLSPKPIEPR